MGSPVLHDQPVLDSLEELLAGADDNPVPMETSGKSGARLERVRIRGESHVVKHLDLQVDWTLRAAAIPGGAVVVLWRRGILHALPEQLVQPIVAVAHDPADPDVSVLLMRDVGEHLVPVTDDVVPLAQHEAFMDHMAAMHAAFWEAGPDIDVVPPLRRYLELSPSMAAAEAARGSEHLVPKLVAQGWPLLAEVAPTAARVVVPLAHDPAPLVTALDRTPQTFVHGNWKLDNLGTDQAGRTIVLDWELPVAVPRSATWPGTSPSTVAASPRRRSRRSRPTATPSSGTVSTRTRGGTASSRLCLLGGLVHFGWEKALGGYDDELAWWEEQAVRAQPLL